jgi:hypothetical protein
MFPRITERNEADVVGLQEEGASHSSTCRGSTEMQHRYWQRLSLQAFALDDLSVALDPTETRQWQTSVGDLPAAVADLTSSP